MVAVATSAIASDPLILFGVKVLAMCDPNSGGEAGWRGGGGGVGVSREQLALAGASVGQHF